MLWTWPCAPGITGCSYHDDLLLIGVHHRRVLLVAGSGEGGPSDLVGPPVLRGTHVYLASATIGYGSSFIRASLHPHSDPDIPGPFATDVPGVVLLDPLPFGSAVRYGPGYVLARGLLGFQPSPPFCQQTQPDMSPAALCQLEVTDPITFPK